MTKFSQDFTVKSNARRAAKKAGVDVAEVVAFVKAGKTLYRFPTELTVPKPRGGIAAMKKVQAATDARIKKGLAEKKAAKKAKASKPAKAAKNLTKLVEDRFAAEENNHLGSPRKAKRRIRDAFGSLSAPKAAGERGLKFVAVAALLRREGGASITEVCAAAGWLPHSARARISVDVTKMLNKGEEIVRRREDGVSHYAIVKSKQLELPVEEKAA